MPSTLKLRGRHPQKQPDLKTTTRKIDPDKIAAFNAELANINWLELLNHENINQNYDIFNKTLQNKLDNLAPMKTVTIPANKVIKEAWMTPELMKCIQKQRKLYKKTLHISTTEKDHLKIQRL